ncbi:MAG: hypothetical protein KJ063_20915 [Anaerolineae bacterium]|nr:hypothetical protein [Anaerolineae bacterium]
MKTDQGNWGQIWVVPLILLLSCLCCWQSTKLYINYVDKQEHRLIPENEKRYMSQLLKKMDTNFEIAYAFTTALRINHSAAYDLTAPELWPKVDEWMGKHHHRSCMTPYIYGGTSGNGAKSNQQSIKVSCTLTPNNGYGTYILEVNDIILINQLVVDWGEIIESHQHPPLLLPTTIPIRQ